MTITIKTAEDIEGMRLACRLAAEVLDYIEPFVKPGITTNELDKLCHDYMVDVQQCIPAPLNYAPGGYKPYPKSICTSINHQVCHGIPNDKPLKKGDSLNIDITTIKNGWHGDTSRMFFVGEPSIGLGAGRGRDGLCGCFGSAEPLHVGRNFWPSANKLRCNSADRGRSGCRW